MEPSHLSLTAASLAFVGTHFLLSHPLRAPLVKMVGPNGFMGLYSVVAFATLGWMIWAFRAAPSGDLGAATGDIGWIVATLLMIPATVLLLGSFVRNPAMPAPGAEKLAVQEPHGVFRVTRHPMMWSFALWAIAHLVLFWSVRTTIVSLAILVLALVGAHMQDRKKETLMGDAWGQWEANTSYWPKWLALLSVGPVLWIAGIAAWLLLTWLHMPTGAIPAGLWKWL